LNKLIFVVLLFSFVLVFGCNDFGGEAIKVFNPSSQPDRIEEEIRFFRNCQGLDGDEDGVGDGECVAFGSSPGKYLIGTAYDYCGQQTPFCAVDQGNCYSQCPDGFKCFCSNDLELSESTYGQEANVETECEEAYGSCCLAPTECFAVQKCGANNEGTCKSYCMFMVEHEISGSCDSSGLICCASN
jgi:hypothetical protein